MNPVNLNILLDANCGFCNGKMVQVDPTVAGSFVFKCENRADDPEEKKHSILTLRAPDIKA